VSSPRPHFARSEQRHGRSDLPSGAALAAPSSVHSSCRSTPCSRIEREREKEGAKWPTRPKGCNLASLGPTGLHDRVHRKRSMASEGRAARRVAAQRIEDLCCDEEAPVTLAGPFTVLPSRIPGSAWPQSTIQALRASQRAPTEVHPSRAEQYHSTNAAVNSREHSTHSCVSGLNRR
jgi:hypothetical protein